ncbi:hypothetical protein OHD62_17295 [Mesorhizobium sp. YC-39]|uniref:hypothetical protein n=1 Tax=unclassified Mesorhizobium TaxID=325217 RepID=UPI0021E89FF6|nr:MULTISPECIES: hypothetical protein [unclassified Mesorhizobium]MCV3209599.1 hypothetical protein [Mesorhizobium sp. YC-2]MCV3230129.1 hypothetical protein [Mesorhizobium sp. YC-39]
MSVQSIRILCQLDFPSKTVRLWDGAGPYLDAGGHIWQGMVLRDSLDVIESALNGEAYTLALGLSGVPTDIADVAYQEAEDGDVIGARMLLMIQDCDELDQPIGSPDIRFTGIIDNIVFDDAVSGDNPTSTVTIECINRFSMRNLISGSVLSDVDQKARSARINPGANPDRFCERIPSLADKTVQWPRFN